MMKLYEFVFCIVIHIFYLSLNKNGENLLENQWRYGIFIFSKAIKFRNKIQSHNFDSFHANKIRCIKMKNLSRP